jgi:hypothetical protein
MPGLANRAPRHLFMLSLLLQVIVAAHSQSLQGTWQGTLSGPGGSLPLIFDLNAISVTKAPALEPAFT